MGASRVTTRAGGAARLVAAAAGLALPPVLLWMMIDNPLPSWPIDWVHVVEAIQAGLIPSTMWMNVLAIVAWLSWAFPVATLSLEVVAVVRNRPSAPGVPDGSATWPRLWSRRRSRSPVPASRRWPSERQSERSRSRLHPCTLTTRVHPSGRSQLPKAGWSRWRRKTPGAGSPNTYSGTHPWGRRCVRPTWTGAGCGTGRVTELVLGRGQGTVVGFDFSGDMLRRAADRLAPYGKRVLFVRGDLRRTLPVAPVFQQVISTATLHWLPGLDRATSHLAAALAPGGVLAIQMGGAGNIQPVVDVVEQAEWTADGLELPKPRHTCALGIESWADG